jgi:hypothetical protein
MDKDTEKETDSSLEEEATVIPEQARQQMENYLSIKEKERETKEAIHKENMKDLEYRRWYYQNQIQKHMDMIPKEYYYQAEYEEMETLCEKYQKIIATMEKEEEMEALFKQFRKKTAKKWNANKIIAILLFGFLILFGGFLIYLLILQNK